MIAKTGLPCRRCILVYLLLLFVSGCSGSIPLLVATHHPLDFDHDAIQNVVVGRVNVADGRVEFKQPDHWLSVNQVDLIKSLSPVYQAVAQSNFVRAKHTRVLRVVLDDWSGTLGFFLRNGEYFSIVYTRDTNRSIQGEVVPTSAGVFQIKESGVWVPSDR